MPRGIPNNKENKGEPAATLPTGFVELKQETEMTNQLFEIIQNLALTVSALSKEVQDIKAHTIMPNTMLPTGTSAMSEAEPVKEASSSVPANILAMARKVLGDKFDFRVEASLDLPQFTFTVIVPPEYSPLAGKQVDERTRIISNAENVNGVKTWCEKVKQNVIKHLGTSLPINA